MKLIKVNIFLGMINILLYGIHTFQMDEKTYGIAIILGWSVSICAWLSALESEKQLEKLKHVRN